jgi:putative hydrolase of the HAD superfamily
MNQQTLILDLDDTLIHCNKYFKESKNKFAFVMRKWFKNLSKEELMRKKTELDIKNVEEHGLHSINYPVSLVETYLYFCKKYKKKLDNKKIEQIRQIGQSVFERKVEPFPHTFDVLHKLQNDGHRLCLFTGGDVANQLRKINQLNLEPFFTDGVFIFEKKDKQALKKVLYELKADKKFTWMIGNSMRTDIIPAIELGINAIHIPSEIEWSYNVMDVEIEPSGTFAQLPSLQELPGYLQEHCFQFGSKETSPAS